MRALELFVCEVDSEDAYTTRLYYAPSIQCWGDSHLWALSLAVAALLLYGVLIPYILAEAFLGAPTENFVEKVFSLKYAWLYRRFNSSQLWWDVILMSRRLCLSLLILIPWHPISQVTLVGFILLLSLSAHVSQRPYLSHGLSRIDTCGMAAGLVLTYAGLFFQLDDTDSWQREVAVM